jgi:hypothetical protein
MMVPSKLYFSESPQDDVQTWKTMLDEQPEELYEDENGRFFKIVAPVVLTTVYPEVVKFLHFPCEFYGAMMLSFSATDVT